MKRTSPSMILLRVLGLILLLNPGLTTRGQSDSVNTEITSKLALNYLCDADSVILTATLSITKGDIPLALKNAPVSFAALSGENPTPVGTIKTNQEGIAVCKVAWAGLPADKNGVISYSATFAGSGKYPAAEASLSAKPARIRLFFSTEDSIRTLKITAVQKNEKGADIPVTGETVLIYTPRLFSLLKIGEIPLDESGTGSMEFPRGIIGDTLGNLGIIARIEESDNFGFAQGRNVINWGEHKQYYKAEVPSRELWTPVAPMWMIITLIIMLTGVWAHYVYAVYELVMIKRSSKKDKNLN